MSLPPSPLFERIRVAGNPVADPAAVVVRGQARFTVLTERLIRCEWSATGAFEDRGTFAFPNRAAPPPPYAVGESDGWLTLDTGALHLRYRLGPAPFGPDTLAITLTLRDRPVTWAPGTPDRGNLGGTRRTLREGPGVLYDPSLHRRCHRGRHVRGGAAGDTADAHLRQPGQPDGFSGTGDRHSERDGHDVFSRYPGAG